MKAVIAALFLFASASASVMRAKPPGAITPALKLRGGLTVGDASPADIAKIALYLKAAAGAYVMLSPQVRLHQGRVSPRRRRTARSRASV